MDPHDPIPPFLALQQHLPSARARRRRERLFRIFLSVLAVCAVLLMAAGITVSRIDPNAHRAEIEALVRQATGRDLTIKGTIRILSWTRMTISARDVTLGNAAWGSRPDMLRMGRVVADLELWPLLSGRLRITRMVLEDADMLLERNAQGVGNWQFDRAPAAPHPSAPGPAVAKSEPGNPALLIRALHLRDAHVHWRDAVTGTAQNVLLRRFTTNDSERDGTVAVSAELVWKGQTISVDGQTGSVERMLAIDPPPGHPWGLALTAHIPGMKATLAGTVERPLRAAGYKLRLDAKASDMRGLSALLGRPLPAFRNADLSVSFADRPDGTVALSDITGRLGTSNLDDTVSSLMLDHARIAAATADEPLKVTAAGTLLGADSRLTATLGSLRQMMSGAEGAPIDLLLTIGDSRIAVAGHLPAYGGDAGLDVRASLRLHDLADLSPLVQRRLPSMRPVSFDGRIAATHDGATIALRQGRLRIPQADIGADADVTLGAHPVLRVDLHGARLDADALRRVLSGIQWGPPSTEMPLGSLPIPRSSRPVISDTKLQLGWLDAFDLDLTASLDQLTLGGVSARAVQGRARLEAGHLIVHPFTGSLAGGPIALTLDIDHHATPMAAALTLKAPALDVRPMLAAFDRTEDISGLLDVDASLRATGASPHDLASTLTGRVGLGMVDGSIDNALVAGVLGGVMRVARVPSDMLFGAGRSTIRCFAARMDAEDGTAALSTLALDVGRALVLGGGTLDLRHETADLHLRPLLRITADGITVPLKVTGRFRGMAVDIDKGGDKAVGALAALSGQALSTVTPGKGADACTAALTRVHGGPPAVLPAEAPPRPLLPNLRLPPPTFTPTPAAKP